MKKARKLLTITALTGLAAPNLLAQLNKLEAWGNAAGTTPAPSFTAAGSSASISAGGADFWGNSDAGAFLWADSGSFTTNGDFTAAARHVSTNEPAPNWGRDGLMVRASASGTPSATDAHWMAMRTSDGLFGTGRRPTNGAGTFRATDIDNPGVNYNSDDNDRRVGTGSVTNTGLFMAVARQGNTLYTGYAADLNGTPGRWVQHWATSNAAAVGGLINGAQVVVGLAHQSHPQSGGGASNGGVNTASFDNLGYAPSFQASYFGAAAGPSTWQLGQTVGVNAAGKVTGSAFVQQGGAATGEKTSWRVTATPILGKAAGLQANIYLTGNPGSIDGARNVIASAAPSGKTVIPNVNWRGGDFGGSPARYLNGTPASFTDAVQATSGQVAFTGNQENYGVHMVGEIFIPSDAARGKETVSFKDGIDDFTYLRIDGQQLINDNDWTGFDGSANGGSPIVSFDASNSKFDDGEWVAFEMISWEGGGGDDGALYWDVNNSAFPADRATAAGEGALVPGANFRHDVLGATQSLAGINQIGSESASGVFTDGNGNTLTLGVGDWRLTVSNANTGAGGSASLDVTVVPEPTGVLLLTLTGLGAILRRRR